MQEQTVAGLQAQKIQALALVAKYMKYQEYLESVLEVTDMFHQLDDLLARHSTLETANTDLRQQQWSAADETEKTMCAPAQAVASDHLSSLRLLCSRDPSLEGITLTPPLSCVIRLTNTVTAMQSHRCMFPRGPPLGLTCCALAAL